MTNYRDALTGQWTTAADAAARPAETVSETVPTRHEAPDVAELRRLLDANGTPWALWNGYGPDGRGDMRVERIGHLSGSGIQTDPDSADMYGPRETFELLVSAVNALPGLLDAATERDALAAAVEHYAAQRQELQALLSHVAERLDDFTYDELAAIIGDEPLDQWGERYRSQIGAERDALAAELAHMTEARDNARAEVERLTATVDAAIDVAHLDRQRAWSAETFGPAEVRGHRGVLDHIRKELVEIEADPGDVTEWADLIILAFDGAWRSGNAPADTIAAIKAKQKRNEARTWPDWRTADPNKVIEHVRAHNPASRED